MDDLLHDLNSLWVLAAGASVAIAAASWALQMSCGFCSIEPPSFPHSVAIVVIIALANVFLQFVLQVLGSSGGLAGDYVAPALAATLVLAIGVPAPPFTALTITAVQIVLCGLMYFVAGWAASVMTMSVYV